MRSKSLGPWPARRRTEEHDTSNGPVRLDWSESFAGPGGEGILYIHKTSLDLNPITLRPLPAQAFNGTSLGSDFVLPRSDEGGAAFVWNVSDPRVGGIVLVR